MTCVWDAIIQGIPVNVLKDHGLGNMVARGQKRKRNQKILVTYLKQHAKMVDHVTVNGKNLSRRQKEENWKATREFDVKTIGNGYYCSAADPFLILVCDMFKCSIIHDYCGSHIRYDHPQCLFTIHISSSSTHMVFQKTCLKDQ